MGFSKKIILTTLTVFLFLFLSAPEVSAQSFWCEWMSDRCLINSASTCSSIAPGTPEYEYCESLGEEDCDGTPSLCQDCPDSTGYGCFETECPADHDPTSYACAGSQINVCCLDNSIEPPPVTECFECNISVNNTCFLSSHLPDGDGDCSPYWESESVCNFDCASATFDSYTCNTSGSTNTCDPAAGGEFQDDVPTVGLSAYANCSNECLANTFEPSDSALCSDNASINTAIGCIPIANSEGDADETAFVGFLLGWGIGIGGGIALILIIVATIMITTSGGDPRRLQAGKELLTAAISGLLLLIFSVFVLRLIGVDLLRIPGFS